VVFGKQHRFPGIRVQETEVDLIAHDTGFIPYLVVSALALDAFIIASLLSAMAVAREFEIKTIKLLAVAPVHPLLPLLGRMLATDTIAIVAMTVPVALAIFGYHIVPLHPLEVVGVMLLCVAIFGCIGVAIGALLKRTFPVVSLIFGLGFPLYLVSGSLEPQRFDGNLIWIIAHLSPVYYAVGILEQAFHGLQVTPEPVWVNFMALFGWAVLTLLLAGMLLRTTLIEKTTLPRIMRQRRIVGARRWRERHPRIVFLSRRVLLVGLLLLVLGGGIWFGTWQHQVEALRVQQQQQQMHSDIAEEQRETGLLNDYMRRISSLIAQNIQAVKITDATRATATALTQKILLQLNPEHKVALLRYLHERKLIDDDYHVVNLQGADFHGCNLTGIDLSDTEMSGANFSNADMRTVKLTSSTLVAVNFNATNLISADIRDADLQNADISNANLAGADLAGSIGKSIEQLLPARSLAGARLPDGSVQPGEVHDTD
jgi:uncharacterized protein YjbI with pentapeptide repeats/ABC-type transport system involved in multi-copper enzyme maturation permease subunit